MNNPWTKLEASRTGYVLDEDLDAVDEFNRSVRDPKTKIVFDALPEPYVGNPDLAKVVFLGLNPGYSVSDPAWHAREDFRRALLLNLKHELKDYPFTPSTQPSNGAEQVSDGGTAHAGYKMNLGWMNDPLRRGSW
jgi:hypothetical protein